MLKQLTSLLHDETGATAVEYGLLLTLISLSIISGAVAIGGSLSAGLNSTAATISR